MPQLMPLSWIFSGFILVFIVVCAVMAYSDYENMNVLLDEEKTCRVVSEFWLW